MKLIFFGDCMFGRDGHNFSSNPFKYVETYLKSSDIIIFNLETVISNFYLSDIYKLDKVFNYQSTDKQLVNLKKIIPKKNIFVSINNNHSLDYRIKGYSSTKYHLKKLGFLCNAKNPVETDKVIFLNSTDHCGCKKTDDNKPLIYCFEIDGVGDIEVKDIFTIACDYLVNKLENINIDLGNLNDNKIEIKKSETNISAFDFIFFDEDNTLGNLLQSYLFKDDNIEYVAYSIPHPLDNKLLLRLSLKKESDKTNMKKNLESVINSIKLIIKNTKKLKNDYQNLLK